MPTNVNAPASPATEVIIDIDVTGKTAIGLFIGDKKDPSDLFDSSQSCNATAEFYLKSELSFATGAKYKSFSMKGADGMAASGGSMSGSHYIFWQSIPPGATSVRIKLTGFTQGAAQYTVTTR